MLVLSRRLGEALILDNEIVFRILDIDECHGRISIGIEAPGSVAVHRQEVYNRINTPGRDTIIRYKRKPRL